MKKTTSLVLLPTRTTGRLADAVESEQREEEDREVDPVRNIVENKAELVLHDSASDEELVPEDERC